MPPMTALRAFSAPVQLLTGPSVLQIEKPAP